MTSAGRHARIAETVSEELAARDDVRAVLLVGSTAAGYADEYSDVDLEVVGSADPGQRTVEDVHVEWTPVTPEDLTAALDGWADDSALYTYSEAAVLYDDAGIEDLLSQYDRYPPDVRKQKLYAGWFYATGDAFDARKADQRGDTRVKRCAATRAVEQFAALTYVLDGSFPPYRKWRFRNLPMELPAVDAALTGDPDALERMTASVETELRPHLSDDRLENPFLYQPSYDRL